MMTIRHKRRTNDAMTPIPIDVAAGIAHAFGYDQIVIYARRIGHDPEPNGEHMTTYGKTPAHCSVAARMGDVLQKFMGWKPKRNDG